jgi:hypothetical protein
MVTVDPIPVDIDLADLSRDAGIDESKAADFIKTVMPDIHPKGAFEQVDPRDLMDGVVPDLEAYGDSVVVGIISLGPDADCESDLNRTALCRLALASALEFLEYRIKLFLKPLGQVPGQRLIPGCPDLPLEANRLILQKLSEGAVEGLSFGEDGELLGPGLAFVHTIGLKKSLGTGCALCTRKDCPARNLVVES